MPKVEKLSRIFIAEDATRIVMPSSKVAMSQNLPLHHRGLTSESIEKLKNVPSEGVFRLAADTVFINKHRAGGLFIDNKPEDATKLVPVAKQREGYSFAFGSIRCVVAASPTIVNDVLHKIETGESHLNMITVKAGTVLTKGGRFSEVPERTIDSNFELHPNASAMVTFKRMSELTPIGAPPIQVFEWEIASTQNYQHLPEIDLRQQLEIDQVAYNDIFSLSQQLQNTLDAYAEADVFNQVRLVKEIEILENQLHDKIHNLGIYASAVCEKLLQNHNLNVQVQIQRANELISEDFPIDRITEVFAESEFLSEMPGLQKSLRRIQSLATKSLVAEADLRQIEGELIQQQSVTEVQSNQLQRLQKALGELSNKASEFGVQCGEELGTITQEKADMTIAEVDAQIEQNHQAILAEQDLMAAQDVIDISEADKIIVKCRLEVAHAQLRAFTQFMAPTQAAQDALMAKEQELKEALKLPAEVLEEMYGQNYLNECRAAVKDATAELDRQIQRANGLPPTQAEVVANERLERALEFQEILEDAYVTSALTPSVADSTKLRHIRELAEHVHELESILISRLTQQNAVEYDKQLSQEERATLLLPYEQELAIARRELYALVGGEISPREVIGRLDREEEARRELLKFASECKSASELPKENEVPAELWNAHLDVILGRSVHELEELREEQKRVEIEQREIRQLKVTVDKYPFAKKRIEAQMEECESIITSNSENVRKFTKRLEVLHATAGKKRSEVNVTNEGNDEYLDNYICKPLDAVSSADEILRKSQQGCDSAIERATTRKTVGLPAELEALNHEHAVAVQRIADLGGVEQIEVKKREFAAQKEAIQRRAEFARTQKQKCATSSKKIVSTSREIESISLNVQAAEACFQRQKTQKKEAVLESVAQGHNGGEAHFQSAEEVTVEANLPQRVPLSVLKANKAVLVAKKRELTKIRTECAELEEQLTDTKKELEGSTEAEARIGAKIANAQNAEEHSVRAAHAVCDQQVRSAVQCFSRKLKFTQARTKAEDVAARLEKTPDDAVLESELKTHFVEVLDNSRAYADKADLEEEVTDLIEQRKSTFAKMMRLSDELAAKTANSQLELVELKIAQFEYLEADARFRSTLDPHHVGKANEVRNASAMLRTAHARLTSLTIARDAMLLANGSRRPESVPAEVTASLTTGLSPFASRPSNASIFESTHAIADALNPAEHNTAGENAVQDVPAARPDAIIAPENALANVV